MKHLFLSGDENIAKRTNIREKIRLSKSKGATRPCGTCGKIIDTMPYKLKKLTNEFCSKECNLIWRGSRIGTKAAHWKGGRTIDKSGYIHIYDPNHPFSDNKGYVAEHRLVIEKHLDRYLNYDEIVHHKDFSKDHNSLTNLVLTTRKEHLVKYHYDSLLKRLHK